MARPTTGYMGTDLPPRRREMTSPQMRPSEMENPLPAPEPRFGDGGGEDPRVPYLPGEDIPEVRDINSENPYGGVGAPGYDDGLGAGPIDIDSARRDVETWVSQQLGIAPDAVGDMTLRDIQALIDQKAPRDQGLRDAMGTVQADQGMAPEDPSMGPGAPTMSFAPDRPRY